VAADTKESIGVCMLTFSMPPEHSGAAKQAITLASKLAEKGVKIFFLTPRSTKFSRSINHVAGFRVVRVNKENVFWKALAPIRLFIALFFERNNFSLIHVHGVGYLSNIAVLFGAIFRKKVIIKMTMFSEDDPLSIKKSRNGWINFFFFSKASKIISITNSFYDSCLSAKLPRSKLSLIPNGVDTDKYKAVSGEEKYALREKFNLPVNKTILVYAGIIRPEKGIDFLLDAMAYLGESRQDIVLLLIGPVETWLSENERNFADKQVQRILGDELKELVYFVGKVDNVQEYFQSADLFISASHREGFPNVLLEAMAIGLPPVVIDIPEVHVNILLDGVDGLVVKERIAKIFATSIERLVDDKGFYCAMSTSAFNKVISKFSVNNIANDYLILYKELTENNR